MVMVEDDPEYSESALLHRTGRKKQRIQKLSGLDHPLITLADSLGHVSTLENCTNEDRQAAVQEVLQMFVDRAADLSEVFPTLNDIKEKRRRNCRSSLHGDKLKKHNRKSNGQQDRRLVKRVHKRKQLAEQLNVRIVKVRNV